jgi:hypothetical protein
LIAIQHGHVYEMLFRDEQNNHNLLTLSFDRIDDSKWHFNPMGEDIATVFANVLPKLKP